MNPDVNDLAYWYPKIAAAGLPVPTTNIVTTEIDLLGLLDGELDGGIEPFNAFIAQLTAAATDIGFPCFLRTGHTSGKHDWADTCFVEDPSDLASHVAALVEASALADMFGLPTNTWVVRRLIHTKPLFRCERWQGFPVTREFRVFIRDDEFEAIYPYWPADAVEQGRPDRDDWRELLRAASELSDDDNERLPFLAGMASGAVGGGYWSIDFLQDTSGNWFLTDMADGAQSYRPEPLA